MLDRKSESPCGKRHLRDVAVAGKVVQTAVATALPQLQQERSGTCEENDAPEEAARGRSEPLDEPLGDDENADDQRVKDAGAQKCPAQSGWGSLPDPTHAKPEQPLPRRGAEDAFADGEVHHHEENGNPVQLEGIDPAVALADQPEFEQFKRYDHEDESDAVEEVRADERSRPGRMPAAGEQFDQGVAQVVERLPATVAIALQPLHHNRFETARNLRALLADRWRLLGDGLRKRGGDALVVVGRLAAEEVVQSGAHRVDVGPVIERFAANLLRRREEHGAEERAALRQLMVASADQRFRQTEVADLDPIILRQEAVGRLHVAVDHADAVGLGETVDDVENPCGRNLRRQRSALVDDVLERFSGHQLHHDVRASGVRVGGEDEHASWVSDLTRKPALLTESLDRRWARGQSRREQLDRDAVACGRRLGLVDGAHAAGSEQPEETITADGLRGGLRCNRELVVAVRCRVVGASPH